MYTFEVHTQASFCLSFKIPGFEHRIHLKPGTHNINAPYHSGALADLVGIEEEAGEAEEVPVVVEQLPPIMTSLMDSASPAANGDYFMEIECKVCTYLNLGRDKCEMCYNDLLI